MLGAIRQRLTFANVTSVIALFCALGGGAYAAVNLPKNSVGVKQIKNGAVTNAKLGKDAVTGAKVKDASLTGSDINLATLPKIGSAANADNAAHADNAARAANADNATHAGSADTATSATKATEADHAAKATTADNIAAPEAFHEVGTAGEPAFAPSASNLPSGTALYAFETAGFYKDREGVVHLKGYVIAGASGNMFVLPPGYRPADKKLRVLTAFCSTCSSTVGGGLQTYSPNSAQIDVWGGGIGPATDGMVQANQNAGQYFSLDGLSFRAGV
jgi:hypothetical protein